MKNFDNFFNELNEINKDLECRLNLHSRDYFINQPECIELQYIYKIETNSKDLWFTLDKDDNRIYMWIGIDFTELSLGEFKALEFLIDKGWK